MQSSISSTDYLGDPARLAALHRYHLLNEPVADEDYDRLTRLAARFLQTPVSLISIVAGDCQIFVSCTGLPEPWSTRRESPLANTFCQQVIVERGPVIIDDTRDDQVVSRHPAVQELGVIAYLGVPLVDADGHVLGALCVLDFKSHRWTSEQIEILNDLASLVMAQIELRSAVAARDETAARIRDEFLWIASHELRNPVAAIKATAQLLKKTLDRGRAEPERLNRYAAELDQTGHRLAVLVNDLLDGSRLRTGQLSLEPEWIDPMSVLRTLVVEKQTDRPLRLECVDGSCTIYADPERLKQVLSKLLDNAVKYSPNRGEITVSVTRTAGQILIQINDSGIGLPAEDVRHNFEPFSRGHDAARRRLPEMGLGLYVCRQIIVAHGGELWVESPDEDVGTTITVCLPLTGPPVKGGAANA